MEIKNFFAQDSQGNIMPSADCYLYLPDTTTLVTGLVNEDGVPISNPFAASLIGQVQFGAPNGVYDLRIARGVRDTTIRIQCADLLQSINEIGAFLGPHASAPATRADGSPLQLADRYLNTTDQLEYLYKSSGWVANNIVSEELAEPEGAGMIGAYLQDGSESTVQEAISRGDEKLRSDLAGTDGASIVGAYLQDGSPGTVQDAINEGDENLKSTLADPELGAYSVGAATIMIDGIVGLQSAEFQESRVYFVSGFFKGTNSGGGSFKYSAAIQKSKHDGINFISPTVPWDGLPETVVEFLNGVGESAPAGSGVFVRIGSLPVNLSQVGGGVGMEKMISSGGLKTIPDGVSILAETVRRDFSSDDSFPALAEPSQRFVVKGDSMSNSILMFNGPGYAIDLKGAKNIPVGQNVLTQTELSQFSLKPSGALASCSGILMTNQAYTSIKDINVDYCNYGITLNSVITSRLDNVYLRSNEVGLQLQGSGFSMPNALSMSRMTIQANRYAGILANKIGGGVKIDGATIEGNGAMGVGGTGGIIGNLDGINGSATLQLTNVYFEGNRGSADLALINTSVYTCTVVLIGCNFHRISPDEFVTNNINLSNNGGGKIRLVMIGCAFMSAGTYIPSSDRPYIQHDANCEIIDIGCSYSETVSMNRSINSSASTVGRIAANGSPISVPVGVTCTRVSAGLYTVSSTFGWGQGVNGYVAIATSSDSSQRAVQRIAQDSGSSFTVVVTDASGIQSDGAFNFSCVRVS